MHFTCIGRLGPPMLELSRLPNDIAMQPRTVPSYGGGRSRALGLREAGTLLSRKSRGASECEQLGEGKFARGEDNNRTI
jgi:hypothetical protein